MDRHNNWQDRRDDRTHDNRLLDESKYRGAYRLDEEGQYSTYYRSNQGDTGHHHDNHGGDYVYRRSRNLQDNDGYTERQYQQSYRGGSARQGVENDFGGRYGGSAGRRDSRSDYNERSGSSGSDNPYHPYHRNDYVHHASSNFDVYYGPDNLPYNPGENYGNMAGSLSYGYDGGYNSDPDYNRRYNPLTGELRQHQDSFEQPQPRRYGPPDNTASNPDYDRY